MPRSGRALRQSRDKYRACAFPDELRRPRVYDVCGRAAHSVKRTNGNPCRVYFNFRKRFITRVFPQIYWTGFSYCRRTNYRESTRENMPTIRLKAKPIFLDPATFRVLTPLPTTTDD